MPYNPYNPYAPYGAPGMYQQVIPPQMVNPGQNMPPQQQMKTPDQLRKEVEANLNQYTQQYNAAQKAPVPGTYVKVDNYEAVANAQVPANGTPMLFIDTKALRLYSKRMDNGQPYIQGFELKPIEAKPEPANAPQQAQQTQEQPQTDENPFQRIMDKLDGFESRIKALEEKKDAKPVAEHADEPAADAKPAGV